MPTRFKYFDVHETCPGFPEDDRLVFKQERCCIQLLVEHWLKSIPVRTRGIRQVGLVLESPSGAGYNKVGDFGCIATISWPFDFARYFAFDAPGRSAMFAAGCESALIAEAERRKWSVTAIQQVFAKVRAANYELHVVRARPCRSPDGRRLARVSYHIDRNQFRVDVEITGLRKSIVLEETIYRERPSYGLSVDRSLGKPFWHSNHSLVIPMYRPNAPHRKFRIKVP
jgi:hypothetical protein